MTKLELDKKIIENRITQIETILPELKKENEKKKGLFSSITIIENCKKKKSDSTVPAIIGRTISNIT